MPSQFRMIPTMAGPKDRVGLMEQPSTGSKMTWAKKTANPIAMHAFLPQEARGDTAVSQTTKQRMKVPRNSPSRTLPTPQRSSMMFVPTLLVASTSQGKTPQSRPAPSKLPSNWATKLVNPWYQGTCPPNTKDKVTAQLIWPPEWCPIE